MKEKLKIGIMIDAYNIYKWQYSIIESILKSEYSEIVLFIKKNNKNKKKGIIQRIKRINKLLYVLYSKTDKKFFKVKDDAFQKIDISSYITDIIEVNVEEKGFSDYFYEKDINSIKTFHLDVILRFGFRIIRGEILNSAKYGIWSYHHDDNMRIRGGPPGFWEVFLNIPVTGCVLQKLTEKLDGGIVLYKSYSQTQKYSVNFNINNYYHKSSEFVNRMLMLLYKNKQLFEEFVKKHNKNTLFYNYPMYSSPNNFTMFKMIIKKLFLRLLNIFENMFFIKQWIILYKFDNDNKISTVMKNYKRIIPPKDRFWADPFIIYNKDKYYAFFEEYIYKGKKGKIKAAIIDKKGFKHIKTIIENTYHLSYPFIFSYKNKFYMIPETKANKTIELYECEEFPYKWTLKKVLFNNIYAVDATLLEYNNKWWMFFNAQSDENISIFDELYVYHTDNPIKGEWKSHILNPVISDVRYSRPAGRIFLYNNQLLRPSQDSSVDYGYSLNLRKIITLNEYEYEEQLFDKIIPMWDKNIIGIHTFNFEKGLSIADAKLRTLKF